MDFPAMRGVDWLENGTAITTEWLDEWEELHGVTVGAGDIVLIRPAAGRGGKRSGRGILPTIPPACTHRPCNGSRNATWR